MALRFAESALLLHCDGAQGAQLFVDDSIMPVSVSAGGSAATSTSGPRLGSASAAFDGASAYLNVAAGAALSLGSADYTIEFFVRSTLSVSGASTFPRLLCDGASANVAGAYQIWLAGNTSMGGLVNCVALAQTTGSGTVVSTTTPLNDGLWHHIAFCRSAGTARAFFDGVLQQSGADSNDYTRGSAYGLRIGARADSAAGTFFNGQLDEIHIVKGLAKYIQTFTPPTQALSALEHYAAIRPFDPLLPRYVTSDPSQALPVVINQPLDLRDRFPFGLHNASKDGPSYITWPWEFKGPGKISGTVKEIGVPTHIPVFRRVRLYRDKDGALVREVWSDPSTGAYEFYGVRTDCRYTVISYDHQLNFRAVVADNLSAALLL